MRKFIFKKANYLLKYTNLIAESENQIIFKVKNYQVVLKYKAHKLICLCSCKAGALLTPCSHAISALTYLTLKCKEE